MNQTTRDLVQATGHRFSGFDLKRLGNAIRKAWDTQYPESPPGKVWQEEPRETVFVNVWPPHIQAEALEIIHAYFARKPKHKHRPRRPAPARITAKIANG